MPSSFRRSKARRRRVGGFTLLEAMATLLILLLSLAALSAFVTSADQSFKSAATDPFAEAAEAFEAITQNLSVATLEPYQDYADSSGAFHTAASSAFTPDHLARRSDLDFVCGPSSGTAGLLTPSGRTTAGTCVFFAEPYGLTQTLAQSGVGHVFNALGYFVEFGGDSNVPSFFTGATRARWRLKQVVQPSESLQLFATTSSAAWIEQVAGTSTPTAILAENVAALIVLPERAAADTGTALAPNYFYDSRDTGNTLTLAQLPPRVRVVLAAIDEASAIRLAVAAGVNAPALIPAETFQNAASLDADIATLDASLTAAKIGHRIFQRDIPIATAEWVNTP